MRNEIRRNETTPIVYLGYLTVGQKNGTEKMTNDKTMLVKKQKTTKQVVVVGTPIKKRLGKMGLGEMLPNRSTGSGIKFLP